VLVLADRLKQMGLPPAALAGVKLAAIGAATDEVVAQEFGRRADLVPTDSKAEGLARAIQEVTRRGERMLVPQADIARPVLVQALAGAGLHVTPVVAYRTTAGSGGIDLPAWLRTAAAAGDEARAHAVTFTSPSTVHNLIGRLALEGGNPCDLLGVVRACIGPVTAEALTTAGLAPHVVATEQSLEGLVEALCEYDWNRQ
jgi:uroporphyrinogen-III synthase